MSTIEDFENAPVGATATSPDGGKAVKTFDTDELPWLSNDSGWYSDEDMSRQGFTFDNSPHPAPTTTREALELAWNLAYPVKEGQNIPIGTEYVEKIEEGQTIIATHDEGKWIMTEYGAERFRTLDPLPDPEPEWLDAPAILASHSLCADTEQIGIWIPSDKDGFWEWPVQQGEFMAHWSELEEVTPLYPKEEQESMISIHKNCGSQVSTDEKDITPLDGDGERSGYSAACPKCDVDLFPFEIDQVPASEVS